MVRRGGQTVKISDFKARCLELLERVRAQGTELIVTRRGEPIARVTAVKPRLGGTSKGLWRDRVIVKGDIVGVDSTDDWESAR